MRRKALGTEPSPGFSGQAGTGTERATPAPSPNSLSSSAKHTVPSSHIAVRRASLSDLNTILALRMALLREHAHNTIYGRLRADAD